MMPTGTPLTRALAAIRRGRMHVDHRFAAVELLEHRQERRVAEIFVVVAREQRDAVGLEHVEGIFDFLEAALGVGERKVANMPNLPG